MGCKSSRDIVESHFLSGIMNIDLGSFAFGTYLKSGTGTPSWGTALGQSKPAYKFTYPGAEVILIGMIYCSVPLDRVSLPLGKGGRIFQASELDECQIASLFRKVFINGFRIDYPFVMVLVKEDSDSHPGRKSIKYSDKNAYKYGEEQYTNAEFIRRARITLGLEPEACWFVYDIEVYNQDELHMSAVIVDKDSSLEYANSSERRNSWLGLIEKESSSYKTPPEDRKRQQINYLCRPYLTAIRTKPFLLLAGISGTGKSRIVRKLAQATDDIDVFVNDEDRWKKHKPANFELIQVKPNWHNSMDVVGFQSNIPEPHYEFTPFVDFVVKAWCHEDTPFFLCLDEMNLAPVEEYFAEFLSAIESRSIGEDGDFETDPIIKPFNSFGSKLSGDMMHHFVEMGYELPTEVEKRLREKGLTLPKNLIVMGTVNMDETTFSFSRKVLDRAMSIEMNKVNYDDFILGKTEYDLPNLTEQNSLLINRPISAQEVKESIASQEVMDFLKNINDILDGTPFKLGYRAANEAILYVAADKLLGSDNLMAALDDFALMKILSRIEGDDSKLVTLQGEKLLDELYGLLSSDSIFGALESSKTLAKLQNMRETLKRDHFVSFWG